MDSAIRRKTAHARLIWLLCVPVLLTACVSVPRYTANPSNPIRTVAVLPLVNNTNDVDAPAYVREQFAKELQEFLYVVKPLNEVDQVLKDQMGVTLGAQLDMTTAQKLGDALGVDGVFYGALDDFSHKITGVYNAKRVRMRAKLVNCKTGETFWKNGVGVKSVLSAGGMGQAVSMGASKQEQKETGEDLKPLFGDTIAAPWNELPSDESKGVGEGIMVGLADKVVSKALKAPLRAETTAAIQILLGGSYRRGFMTQAVASGAVLPVGPGAGGATATPVAMTPLMMPAFDQVAKAMFAYAFNVNGYWLGNKPYRPGEWTRWKVVSGGDTHELEKAFLKQEAEGKQWWRVGFVEKDQVIFEGLFAPGIGELVRLRGKFSGDEVSEIPVTQGGPYQKPGQLTSESWKGAFVRKESVTVPAGTFRCDYLAYGVPGAGVSEWWLSDQVPGGVVRYLYRESKGSAPVYEISLSKFGQSATTVLKSY